MKHSILLSLAIIFLAIGCKKDKPGTVATITTTAATNVTASSITTGGNITDDGRSGITQRGIAWALHTAPTVGDSITNGGTGTGSFTSNLTGLNSNTTYYLRAYAINASGTAYGNEVSVQTSAGTPTVTTTAISNILPLSAVSGGNITNDGGASVTERGVVYGTSANPTINNFKIVTGSGTGNFTATLSPLASQQAYYVRAYATNSYGTSYGNQVQFNAASANTVTDIDGNVYPYVTLCGKSWMAANLKTTKYKNGDEITNGFATSGFSWSTTTIGAYSFPNGVVNKKDTFGIIYNLYAVNDTRGICPTGWHVPTDDEWKALEVCQGMLQSAADSNGYRGTIASTLLEGGGSGLNLKKSGILFPSTGGYFYFNVSGLYWTSTSSGSASTGNWYRAFNLNNNANAIYRNYATYVMSVRCIKD